VSFNRNLAPQTRHSTCAIGPPPLTQGSFWQSGNAKVGRISQRYRARLCCRLSLLGRGEGDLPLGLILAAVGANRTLVHYRRKAALRAALHRAETAPLAVVRHPRMLPRPATTPWQSCAASLSQLRTTLRKLGLFGGTRACCLPSLPLRCIVF
jgi:hypothetical protein